MKATFRNLLRWVGPLAIAGGVLAVLSELVNLPVSVPGLSVQGPTGYEAVGSGVLLISMSLLLVGMAGLHARQVPPPRDAARVVEYGTPSVRYLEASHLLQEHLADFEEGASERSTEDGEETWLPVETR